MSSNTAVKCGVVELHDGAFAVRLGRGWVAFGVPYRSLADYIADMCNSRLEDNYDTERTF